MRPRFPWLFLVLASGACEGDPNLVEYGVYGYVTEATNGSPISGARVEFTSDTLRTGSDRTDGDGRYEILIQSDIAFGHLTVSDAGHETKVEEVYFDEETRRIDVALGPAKEE